MVREVIEFAVKFFGGGSDEPTKDKPVMSSTIKTERSEVSVKKAVDFDHDAKVKVLAEESMKVRAEMAGWIEKAMKQSEKGEDGRPT